MAAARAVRAVATEALLNPKPHPKPSPNPTPSPSPDPDPNPHQVRAVATEAFLAGVAGVAGAAAGEGGGAVGGAAGGAAGPGVFGLAAKASAWASAAREEHRETCEKEECEAEGQARGARLALFGSELTILGLTADDARLLDERQLRQAFYHPSPSPSPSSSPSSSPNSDPNPNPDQAFRLRSREQHPDVVAAGGSEEEVRRAEANLTPTLPLALSQSQP